jgi:hypothetical protein
MPIFRFAAGMSTNFYAIRKIRSPTAEIPGDLTRKNREMQPLSENAPVYPNHTHPLTKFSEIPMNCEASDASIGRSHIPARGSRKRITLRIP